MNTALGVGKGLQETSAGCTVDSNVLVEACCMRGSFVDCIALKAIASAAPAVLTSRQSGATSLTTSPMRIIT